jgi:hypothetical protein
MIDETTGQTPRVAGADPEQLGEGEQNILEGQSRKWGAPLGNHLIYARVPEIFHGAQGMWRGLDAARTVESTLLRILNRRVAILNGCVF